MQAIQMYNIDIPMFATNASCPKSYEDNHTVLQFNEMMRKCFLIWNQTQISFSSRQQLEPAQSNKLNSFDLLQQPEGPQSDTIQNPCIFSHFNISHVMYKYCWLLYEYWVFHSLLLMLQCKK